MPGKADIAKSLFDAYQKQDRALGEKLIAKDFTFTSPKANGAPRHPAIYSSSTVITVLV